MEKVSFLRYMHNFRGLAILFIIAGHISNDLYWGDNVKIKVFYQSILQNGTVYFIFIAGFLFQHLSAKYQYKTYLSKKIQYVILPYLIVSAPIIFLRATNRLPNIDWFDTFFSNWPLLGKILMYLVTGAHLRPFWFIPMIAIFYIISPILIWIDKHPKTYWILPFLLTLSVVVPKPYGNCNPFQSFIHFLAVYVLGMFSCHYRERLFTVVEKILPLMSLGVIVLLGLEVGIDPRPMYLNIIHKSLLCLIVLYGLQRIDKHIPDRVHAWLNNLANLSFGIYFLHDYFLLTYFKVIRSYWGENNIWTQANLLIFSMLITVAAGLSIVSILVVKKLLGKKSRFVVGC